MKEIKASFKKIVFKLLEIVRRVFSGLGLRKIGFIGRAYNYLFSHSKPEYFEIDGRKIYTDELDILQLYRSRDYTYEDYVNEIVKKEVKSGDVFLDLGAHVGYYTAMAAELVGPNGKVYSFEPDPGNFSPLSKTVAANGYKNVTLVQKAISDKTGIATFFLYGSTNNSMAPKLYDRKSKTIDVQTTSLDEFFVDHPGKVDFIKMDIEGAEGLALKGMRNLIKNNDLKMVTEFAPEALRKLSNIDPIDFLNDLLNAGFDVFEIHTATRTLRPIFDRVSGQNKLKMAMVEELTKQYTPNGEVNCFGTNLFCVKSH